MTNSLKNFFITPPTQIGINKVSSCGKHLVFEPALFPPERISEAFTNLQPLINKTKQSLKRFNESPLTEMKEITELTKMLGVIKPSVGLIQILHKKLIDPIQTRADTVPPGNFRTKLNSVASGSQLNAKYTPPTAEQMHRALDELDLFIKDNTTDIDPLVKAGLIYAQFLTIHPFYDGNGRVIRAFTNFFLCSHKVLLNPNLHLDKLFRSHNKEYCDRLMDYRFDQNGIEKWLKFFLTGLTCYPDNKITGDSEVLD
ncbi:MAG: Fic family protein [Planctomycetes bacterium]|nr:Fic family protein [Planctomycetota bacterium]